jgi:glycosyltransferase involved in cell wall biosynthesis
MHELRKLGVDVTFFDQHTRQYRCEILHMFGCHYWVYHIAAMAKSKGIRTALSPISYVPGSHWMSRIWGLIDPLIPVDTTYRLNRKLIDSVDMLLPNSIYEAEYLRRWIGASGKVIHVIPNGVASRFASGDAELFRTVYGLRDFVLCVGKIEPRKNQLQLVRAFSGFDQQLVLIGDGIPNRFDYYEEVVSLVKKAKNIAHLPSFDHDSPMLASAYAAARIHVLLGKNETPGLVNLEAGIGGCNLVVAECPPVREYLGDYAYYCNPESLESIRSAIIMAWEGQRNPELKAHILRNFSWEEVASKTLLAYGSIK